VCPGVLIIEKLKSPILDANFDYTIKKYGIKTKFNIDKINLVYLEEGNHKIGDFNFSIINTPGHTSCSVVYYFEDEKFMFTGDFLFKRTIGITNTQLSNKEDMKKSLEKIKPYPNDITIYPGHGEISTLGYEKIHNRFLI